MGRGWWIPRTVLALASVGLALVLAGAPVSAQLGIPEPQELALGRVVAAQIIAEYGLVGDAGWLGFLEGIRDRLIPFSGRPGIPYQVGILNHGVPNAASTPGWIFVTAGLVRLNPEVDGWAFVLAHEIAHIARRHMAQHIARAQAGQLASILVAVLTGSRAAQDVMRLLVQVAALGFSRELEVEADREALRMLVEAGFDPEAAARTLLWFNEVTGRRNAPTGRAPTPGSRIAWWRCGGRTRSSERGDCRFGCGTSGSGRKQDPWCCSRNGWWRSGTPGPSISPRRTGGSGRPWCKP
jgi:predicted Zn-dependent protease